MKQYNGFKSEKAASFEPVPAGGYVCRIKAAEVKTFDWGEQLLLAIDITEGEFAGYYQKRFDARTSEDEKWKGVFRIRVPREGDQYFDSEKRTFNNLIYCIEASNNGFHWAWDEGSLKGKEIGLLFRRREWENDEGKTGWMTEPCIAVEVDAIRSGKFKVPADKPLKNGTVSTGATVNGPFQSQMQPVDDDEEIPF